MPAVAFIMFYFNGNPDAAPKPLLWAISIIILFFYKSTVLVNDRFVKVMFGAGLLRKTIKLGDIESCIQVQNAQGNSWGIIWAIKGWIYNTKNFNAVELKLKNGKISRIATDKPEELMNFINSKLPKQP
jgi:hypothetical protein